MDVQVFLNKAYIKLFGLDMSEFADAGEYKSLNALFTRPLAKHRTLGEDFISPCDGNISIVGSTSEDRAVQAKGFCYSIDELVDDKVKEAAYMTIYLSPKDYHRFHAPCDFEVEKTTFISGSLLPVNGFSTGFFKNLFTRNERVVLKCKSGEGKLFYMVYVGALNVGSISLKHIEKRTNSRSVLEKESFFEGAFYKKGDEVGMFNMGSTIIIVGTQNELLFESKEGKTTRFGEKIGSFR